MILDAEKVLINDVETKHHYSFDLTLSFHLDFKFWAIIPNVNINIHSDTLEFEWLCFALYIEK